MANSSHNRPSRVRPPKMRVVDGVATLVPGLRYTRSEAMHLLAGFNDRLFWVNDPHHQEVTIDATTRGELAEIAVSNRTQTKPRNAE